MQATLVEDGIATKQIDNMTDWQVYLGWATGQLGETV
jgi:hypothetical protein